MLGAIFAQIFRKFVKAFRTFGDALAPPAPPAPLPPTPVLVSI